MVVRSRLEGRIEDISAPPRMDGDVVFRSPLHRLRHFSVVIFLLLVVSMLVVERPGVGCSLLVSPRREIKRLSSKKTTGSREGDS